ncbi:MAG: MarR family transcriptional regulator [Actinomycetota bacterium]|nr:MarR family transcriptional regulator [Actinomycetota bacterium]MDQ2955558.1 MarR family transcriptional regulator [Actinomycetota bacterium]
MRGRLADGEERSLSDLFWAVARRMRHVSQESLSRWDISPSHARVLSVLSRHGTMRLSEVAQHLRIAPRSTTEVVDALESRGLIERRPDPSDRRATLVVLTQAGAEIANEFKQARSVEAEAYFEPLTAADRDELTRILRKLVD